MSSNASTKHSWKLLKLASPYLAGAILIAGICQPAFASKKLCVNPGGNFGWYSSIADAVAAAPPGSTIVVAPVPTRKP